MIVLCIDDGCLQVVIASATKQFTFYDTFWKEPKSIQKTLCPHSVHLLIPIIPLTTALAPATRKSMSLDHYYHTISDDTHRVGTGGTIFVIVSKQDITNPTNTWITILVIASVTKQSIVTIHNKTHHRSLLRSAHRDDE